MTTPRDWRVEVDAIPFLEYLHEHAATARLAEALAEIAYARRALRALRPIPVEVRTNTRIGR